METVPSAKKKAIIAYCTLIGLLIAMSMNSNHKDAFATKHIQNMFGLTLLWFCSQVITLNVNPYLGDILWLTSLVLTIYSVIQANKDRLPNIPILSDLFIKWFTFLD